MRSHHVSVVIARSPEEVYAFASDPDQLPRWAAGLANAPVAQDGEDWVVESPMGLVRVRFAAPNDHGILDHTVFLPDGTSMLNPLRVVAHPHGAEVVFTARQVGMSDEEFARDVAAIEADLATLKALLEN